MSALSDIITSKPSGNVGTFSYEKTLPKLPLPDIKQTLEELDESLQPLYYADGYYKHPLDPGQIKTFSEDVATFLESDAAVKLQQKLQEFDDANDCYLDNLHLDINNNTSRDVQDDVLPRNPFLVLADDAVIGISQAERSAVLIHSALRFVSALRHGILPPDINAKGNNPLSMVPYLNLFGTTRCPVFIPGEVENFDLDKPYTDSDLENRWPSDSCTSSPSLSLGDDVDEYSVANSIDAEQQNSNIPSPSPTPATTSSSNPDRDLFSRHGISSKQYPDSKHILVISKGQYYSIDVLDDENNILHNVSLLTSACDYILTDSKESSSFKKSTALGSLTSHSFRNWKYARKRLQKRYPDELVLIDSALFVLVLDESTSEGEHNNKKQSSTPLKSGLTTSSEDCKRLFYGTSIIDNKGHQVGSCVSRWYDKLQLVVTADSKAAVIWDSFTCDGSVVLRFTSETYTESVLRLARDVNAGDPRFSLWPSISDIGSKKPLMNASSTKLLELDPRTVTKKIDWDFSNILNTHVHLSETKLADLISKYDIVHVSIPFGRRAAQRLGINPDSMIQVALQIAHYALYGRMVYGFEPVSTRGFKNSRSCFINVQNQDLLELCQEFISNTLDGPGKFGRYLQACEKHSEKIRMAKSGGGYEKHFNALKYIYKFHEHYGITLDSESKKIAENVFENPLVAPFSAPELIVANCGNAATTTFGITPAVPQGFGIGYIIKDDQCDLTVTSQFRQGDRLMFMLNWVLTEIRNFWKMSNESAYNKNGVKISPLVDKLYEMDNALNSLKQAKKNTSTNGIIKGYGFFDLQAHIDSRSASRINSQSNSSAYLSEMASTSHLNINKGLMAHSKHSSAALSVPTEEEKKDTGYQIQQIQPNDRSESDEDLSFTTSRPDTRKRNNVINSKFEIDFDRSGVGRKVKAAFE